MYGQRLRVIGESCSAIGGGAWSGDGDALHIHIIGTPFRAAPVALIGSVLVSWG